MSTQPPHTGFHGPQPRPRLYSVDKPDAGRTENALAPDSVLAAAAEEATNPDRIACDALIYEQLCDEGFSGAEWRNISRLLAVQALPTVRSWIGKRKIFELTAEKGMELHPDFHHIELLRQPELRDELAHMTVATALKRLQNSWRKGGGWRPYQGASITTWFIGSCIFAFASEFGRFRTEHRPGPGKLVHLDDPEVAADNVLATATCHADFREREIVEEQVQAVLAHLDPTDQAIVRAKIWHDTNKEIAERSGISEKTVERRWTRLLAEHPQLREFSRGGKRA